MLKKLFAAAVCAAMLGCVCLSACDKGGKLPEIPKGFSAEQHTATDFLLDKDGNATQTTIFDFAERVSAADDGTEFADLSSVVPVRTLFHIEGLIEIPSTYAGEEYGYDVKVDGDFCNVILVDFSYEGEMEKDDAFQVTATVIMNQAFRRVVRGGGYSWLKYDGKRPLYAVANPRFLGLVRYADGMSDEDGVYGPATGESSLHIRESWVRYENVLYKDRDYCGRPQYFSGTTVAASDVAGAAEAASGLGEIDVTYYFDTVSDGLTTYCGGVDVGIGFYQRLFNTDYYTGDYLGYIKRVRVAGFNPYGYGGKDSVGGIFLADVGASASFKVVPSKTCRLYIAGEFNIVRIDGEENDFTVEDDHALDQHFEYLAIPDESYISDYIKIEGDESDITSPLRTDYYVYVYPGGVLNFYLSTAVSGTYKFTFNDSVPGATNAELMVEGVELIADSTGYIAALSGKDGAPGASKRYLVTIRNKAQRYFINDTLSIEYIA